MQHIAFFCAEIRKAHYSFCSSGAQKLGIHLQFFWHIVLWILLGINGGLMRGFCCGFWAGFAGKFCSPNLGEVLGKEI